MARGKQSAAEDLMEITSRFPWWVGTILAIGSYLWLHNIASKGMPLAANGDLSQAMRGGMYHAFATFGQYVLPFIFGFGALLSVIAGFKRKRLHDDVSNGARSVSGISWQDFEILIGEHFRRKGFTVHETDDGPDGGADLILNRNAEKYLVQCKQWKTYKVGVKIVRELLGTMVAAGATGGYVVTSGKFTKDAVAFARDNNIRLIDRPKLDMIFKELPRPNSVVLQAPNQTDKDPVGQSDKKAQICSKCGSPMVVRVAKRGSRAGQKFLGCAAFPNCRFTLPLT